MANGFCTQCGKALEEDAKFCIYCGASLDGETVEEPSQQESAAVCSDIAAAPVNPVPVASANKTAGDATEKKGGLGTGAIIGIVVAIVAVIVVILLVMHPWSKGSDASDASASSSGATQTVALEDEDTAEGATANDEEIYEGLVAAYEAMPAIDERIANCATTFNNDFLKTDMSVRQSDANDAAAILSDINDQIEALEALNVGESSDYYDDYQAIANLQNDLKMRISVIDEAWQISLKYSDPSSHKSEILAPLDRDKTADGTNTYKIDYNDNYDSSAPTEK